MKNTKNTKNRKWLSLILLIVLMGSAAPALGDSLLRTCLDAECALLLDTSNVSMRLNASFTLDGIPFKQAALTHLQEGTRSLRDLVMTTPAEEGDRISGYTLYTDDITVLSMESGIHECREYYIWPEKNTILRRRNGMNSMLQVLGAAAGAIGTDMTEEKDETGTTLTLQLGGTAPEINAILTLGAQYFAAGYTGIDFFSLTSGSMSTISDYITPAWGMAFCTESLTLDALRATMRLDSEGRPENCAGTAAFTLTEKTGFIHSLTIEWTQTAYDYGTTALDGSDPLTYDHWHTDCECGE